MEHAGAIVAVVDQAHIAADKPSSDPKGLDLECHLPAALAVLRAEGMGKGCANDGGRRHLFTDGGTCP